MKEGNNVSSLVLDLTLPFGKRSNIALLCKHLNQCKGIRHVTLLSQGDFCPEDVSAVFQAFRGKVIQVRFHKVQLPHSDFQANPQRTVSLNSVWKYEELPEYKRSELSRIVGSLPRLEVLRIVLDGCYSPADLCLQLELLHSHPTLRKLVISGFYSSPASDGAMNQLLTLLQSTVPFKSLKLKQTTLNRLDAVRLLQGLSCCSTLVCLSLDCQFGTAVGEIVNVFREERLLKPSLQEFRFYEGTVPFTSEPCITTILTPIHVRSMYSMGSSLQVLKLDVGLENIRSLLEALTMKGSQLVTLSIKSLLAKSWLPWIPYIPEMATLRELVVEHKHASTQDTERTDFLVALWKNGSLQKVTISDMKWWWHNTEMQQLQSYCDRNRLARGLLHRHILAALNCVDRQPFLCPSLCQVMKPALRVAPSVIFSGLMVCCDNIGPLLRLVRVE
jgi:hypothetical protein